MSTDPGKRAHARGWLLYLLTIGGTALVFLAIRAYGERALESGAPVSVESAGEASATAPASDALFHVLLAMAAVIATGRAIGIAFRRLRQPQVLGEIVAGILLGPSLLGWIAPELHEFLLPDNTAPLLRIVAELGVILYMFLVGLELNTGLLRERGRTALAISHAGIVVPFLLGSLLALLLYGRFEAGATDFTVFALFIGTALSVTAFPVLARILADHGLSRSRLGTLALACAAVDDVTAWCLLAFVVGIAQSNIDSAAWTIVFSLAYTALMLVVVRPIMGRIVARYDQQQEPSPFVVPLVYVCVLVSALITERIGIHALFGAFLMGAVIPHDSRIARDFIQKLEDIVAVLLLPAFFAFTGMRTEIGLIDSWANVAWCLVIIVVATLGKFAGTALAGRWTGLAWGDAAAIGTLMNTRGLMELIVLNVGLDLGAISPTLFTMLVIMALVTTITTAPVLHVLVWRSELARDAA